MIDPVLDQKDNLFIEGYSNSWWIRAIFIPGEANGD